MPLNMKKKNQTNQMQAYPRVKLIHTKKNIRVTDIYVVQLKLTFTEKQRRGKFHKKENDAPNSYNGEGANFQKETNSPIH